MHLNRGIACMKIYMELPFYYLKNVYLFYLSIHYNVYIER
jgi:hypothetical protein